MSLKKAIEKLDKKFGEGTVRPFSAIEYPDIETVSTGSLLLDYAIGGRKELLGIPRGRTTILWGPKGSGKSTLSYHIIANTQKAGGIAALIDTEFSFDPRYAAACGIDTDELLHVRCFTKDGELISLEDIWEIVENLVRSGEVQTVIVDSLDNMVPRVELEGEYGDSFMGKRGFLNAQAARKLVGPAKRNNTALVLVAQVRHKLGVLFGSSETMSGGEAIRHWASLRINMQPKNQIKEKGDVVGRVIRCFIPWNKIAPPCGRVEIELYFGEGFLKEAEILEMGAEADVIEKRSSYYYFSEDDFIQGKGKAIQYLKNNTELAESLESQIRERLSGLREETEVESPPEQDQES
jgi:recombination protein RecA